MSLFNKVRQKHEVEGNDKILEIVQNTESQMKLAEVAKTATSYDLFLAAVNKLTDQRLIVEVVKSKNFSFGSDVLLAFRDAVSRISNLTDLEEIKAYFYKSYQLFAGEYMWMSNYDEFIYNETIRRIKEISK